ncbi:unnamed protein product [Euphydryas editha]|uniref:Ribosomal protein S14 n=1 Tax=Euphydryas editha TaxID=104508 RepID=A0AAU9UDJ9_EUPED|nr:unnamed protein product [Euphydryas editha]
MGVIQKQEYWIPYELKSREVERRLFACEQLLERQRLKRFLHCTLTAPGHTSTSNAKLNIYGSKIMICIYLDQLGVVYYKLLKPTETIKANRY